MEKAKKQRTTVKAADFDLVIGLTGLKAAGKDVLAEMLVGRNFGVRRCSDEIIEEAKRRGIETPSFQQKIEIGNWGRDSGDGAFWAKRVLETMKARNCRLVVINGLRHPDEVAGLRRLLGRVFVMAGIVAPTPVRAKRLLDRQRPGDPKNMEEFLQLDDADRGIGQPAHGQQVDRTLATVPYENVFNNTGTLEEYRAWVEAFADRLLAERK